MATHQLREVVQNILDAPVPKKVKQQLLKPLRLSKGGKPRRERETRMQTFLERFGLYAPHGNQTISNYQNKLLRLYDALEGEESIIDRLRERVNTTFYLRYSYSYVIVNNKDRRKMLLYK